MNIEKIALLTRKYESNGNPGLVSSGKGDIGGKSYGLYQFASNIGIVDSFVSWLCFYPDNALANYGRALKQYAVNSEEFISTWEYLGKVDPGHFGQLQDEYIIHEYYDKVVQKLKLNYFNVDNHSDAIKAVTLSRTIQNGVSGCVRLFNIVIAKLGYSNLSYIDNIYFDRSFISAVYDFLIEECDSAYLRSDGWYRSTYDFCHGGNNIIYGLRNRFVHEKEDALSML